MYTLRWNEIEPRFTALLNEDPAPHQLPSWLKRWSDLEKIVWEARAGLKRDRSRDETNMKAQRAFQRFLDEVFSPYQVINQQLKTKLLGMPASVPEHVQMLRCLRAEAEIFCQENVPLQAEIAALSSTYQQKIWEMTVQMEGETIPLPQVEERAAGQEWAWRLVWQRWLEERETFDQLFLELLKKRRQLAYNAGFGDYRAYRWQEMWRLDYTPVDCLALHQAIETEIIPLARTWREARRQALGLTSIRPWKQDDFEHMSSRPFADVQVLEALLSRVFHQLDPEFGALFERMRHGYLDLGSRHGKPHGGEEWIFPVTGLPYVRAYTSGSYDDVNLVLHECGHALHDALSLAQQDLFWNMGGPDEFCEFAAITMTYLAKPYLEQQHGGPYTPELASYLFRRQLEEVAVKWLPSIAVVDAFQHWVYVEAPEQVTPAELDAKWLELSRRFDTGIDWSGLEAEQAAGWQRVSILFSVPFYQVEYLLAHLGALQVWQKAQQDFPSAWRAYREALLLGNTRPLPELYQAAGAELPFRREVVSQVADLLRSSLRQ